MEDFPIWILEQSYILTNFTYIKINFSAFKVNQFWGMIILRMIVSNVNISFFCVRLL